jgi:hypothetical protein
MTADRRDFDNGADFARQLMPSIAFHEGDASNPVVWWAGFLGCIAGGMTASVGAEGAAVLAEAVNRASTQVLQSKAN